MKDKTLQIRIDDKFKEKIEFLKSLNSWKTVSETVWKVIEKEFRRENMSLLESNYKSHPCALPPGVDTKGYHILIAESVDSSCEHCVVAIKKDDFIISPIRKEDGDEAIVLAVGRCLKQISEKE